MGDGPWGSFSGVELEGRRLYSTSQLHLGYKTEGFTPGEPLDAAVILRIGVAAEL